MARIDVSREKGHFIELNLEDVECNRPPPSKKKYCFSDGVGRISTDLGQQVIKQVNKETRTSQFSAFQMRYAGCKGMLVIDPTLPKKTMLIRKSMNKIESNATSLEILKVSDPRPVYLNRPFITILEQMGVPSHVFLRMQMGELQDLTNAFMYQESAFRLIKAYSSLTLPSDIKNLTKAGINILKEPFFREVLDSLINHCLFDLKVKARIKLQWNEGRMMFGVMDETNTLEYGQVFVQYTDKEDIEGALKILKGTILVTKNPC